VLFITLSCFALGAIGGGKVSLDHAFSLHLHGWLYGGKGVAVTAIGVIGAIGLLVVFWRPAAKAESS
jgi:hypothetical protein